MREAEYSLLAVLREKQTLLASLGYGNARRMLDESDRFVETLKVSDDRFIYLSGQAIQDLGPDHRYLIEVSISVISVDAHIGGYVRIGPDSPPDIDATVFRRPLDPIITYNICELIVSGSPKRRDVRPQNS